MQHAYAVSICSTQSMRRWKVAGALNKPNGSVAIEYKHYGVEKVVFSLGFGDKQNCQ